MGLPPAAVGIDQDMHPFRADLRRRAAAGLAEAISLFAGGRGAADVAPGRMAAPPHRPSGGDGPSERCAATWLTLGISDLSVVAVIVVRLLFSPVDAV